MSETSHSNDLRNRIFFTLFILSVYRFGTFVPIPGIDPDQLQLMMQSNQKGLLGMFNVFAGGAISRMAIFALGIMPYISSSIIVQLLTGVSDYFKNLKSQGETGRQKITQITRYGTVLLATIQGYGLAVGLESSGGLVINFLLNPLCPFGSMGFFSQAEKKSSIDLICVSPIPSNSSRLFKISFLFLCINNSENFSAFLMDVL